GLDQAVLLRWRRATALWRAPRGCRERPPKGPARGARLRLLAQARRRRRGGGVRARPRALPRLAGPAPPERVWLLGRLSRRAAALARAARRRGHRCGRL